MDNLFRQKYRAALGRVIRNEREAQGLSLRKFGLMVGLDYKRMHEIEHGKANATINSLLRISEGLGIPFSSLVAAAEKDLVTEDRLATTSAGKLTAASSSSGNKRKPYLKFNYEIALIPSSHE